MGNVNNYERRMSGQGVGQGRSGQGAAARRSRSQSAGSAAAGLTRNQSSGTAGVRQVRGQSAGSAEARQARSAGIVSGAGGGKSQRSQAGRSRSSKSYGSAVSTRSQDRARRRRRRRRQQRMLLFLLLVLAVAVIGGIFGVRRFLKNKARGELRDQGIASLDAGDYEAAIEKFDQALESAGGKIGRFEADVLELRAEAEYREADYEAALHTWELLLQKDADNQIYQEGAVLCLLETGDYDRALSFGVLQSRVYNRMAVEQISAGDYDQALETIALGMQAPENSAAADLLYNQAAAFEYKGDYQKALELYEAYIAQYGSDEKAEREITFLKSRQGS